MLEIRGAFSRRDLMNSFNRSFILVVLVIGLRSEYCLTEELSSQLGYSTVSRSLDWQNGRKKTMLHVTSTTEIWISMTSTSRLLEEYKNVNCIPVGHWRPVYG